MDGFVYARFVLVGSMRVATRILCAVICALAVTRPVSAQHTDTSAPLPSRSLSAVAVAPDGLPPSERLRELDQWSHDYTEWKTWFQQWRNTRQPGWVGTRPRRATPEPPAWLADYCPVPADDATPLADGCRLLDDWRTDDVAASEIVAQAAATRSQLETPTRSVWWHHVHLDALWPMTEGGSGVFGVIGVHATMKVSGRVQIFIAPGAMLVRVPDIAGAEHWQPATDWGFSYRVASFVFPGLRRPSTLHLNLAKVWMLGRAPETLAGFDSGMYLAGCSLTFRSGAS
jgi:hypothetical protein